MSEAETPLEFYEELGREQRSKRWPPLKFCANGCGEPVAWRSAFCERWECRREWEARRTGVTGDEWVDVGGYTEDGTTELMRGRSGAEMEIAAARALYVAGRFTIEEFEAVLDRNLRP